MSGHKDLHEAAFAGDVLLLHKLLEENNKSVNEKDRVGQTALHKAAMNGWLTCVELLLEQNAQANISDVAGCTALHCAAANGYVETVQCLIEKGHANVAAKTRKGHTPRYMAKSRGHSRLVTYFNEMENKLDGNSWLS